jgi:stress-induced morphogen
MEQEILNALRAQFPDIQGDVTLEPTTDRYNGHILSEGFQGLSFVERQSRVFNILREALEEDSQRISMLFTYTPFEYEQLQAA